MLLTLRIVTEQVSKYVNQFHRELFVAGDLLESLQPVTLMLQKNPSGVDSCMNHKEGHRLNLSYQGIFDTYPS